MAIDTDVVTEKELYEPIKEHLRELFQENVGNCYLEITADGIFNSTIERVVRHDIIFSFLNKKASPDLTGFITVEESSPSWLQSMSSAHIKEFITVEVKKEAITLQDIYQAKLYGDLFQARYALLVSPKPIPEKIRRLDRQISICHRMSNNWVVYIGEWYSFEDKRLVSDWLPHIPFHD